MSSKKQARAKAFHLHIPKCGGTSLNLWLSTLADTERACKARTVDDAFYGEVGRGNLHWHPDSISTPIVAELAERYDILHSHIDISKWLPSEVVLSTLLRSPQARCLSQFRDFKRLKENDIKQSTPREARLVRSTWKASSLADLYSEERDNPYFYTYFVDTQCWHLLKEAMCFRDFMNLPTTGRAELAIQRLEKDFTVYGTLEDLDLFTSRLACTIGMCPPGGLHQYNRTDSQKGQEESDCLDLLDDLNQADWQLYNHVNCSLASESREISRNLEYFESRVLPYTLKQVTHEKEGICLAYSMNEALVCFGLHARDAPGNETTCRWLGSAHECIIFLPAPQDWEYLTLRIHVKGWRSPSLRTEFHANINKKPWEHQFAETPNNVADIIEFKHIPINGPWVKIQIDTSNSLTDEEAGHPSSDNRKKYFNLWKIEICPGEEEHGRQSPMESPRFHAKLQSQQ